MSADNTHFHHRLMRRGFSTRRALVALVGLAVFWAAVGVSLDAVLRAPEWVSLVAFLVAGGVTSPALTGRREASAASKPRVDVT